MNPTTILNSTTLDTFTLQRICSHMTKAVETLIRQRESLSFVLSQWEMLEDKVAELAKRPEILMSKSNSKKLRKLKTGRSRPCRCPNCRNKKERKSKGTAAPTEGTVSSNSDISTKPSSLESQNLPVTPTPSPFARSTFSADASKLQSTFMSDVFGHKKVNRPKRHVPTQKNESEEVPLPEWCGLVKPFSFFNDQSTSSSDSDSSEESSCSSESEDISSESDSNTSEEPVEEVKCRRSRRRKCNKLCVDYDTPQGKKSPLKQLRAMNMNGYHVELAPQYESTATDKQHRRKADELINNLRRGNDSPFYLFKLRDHSNVFEARITKNFRLVALKLAERSRNQPGCYRIYAVCAHSETRHTALSVATKFVQSL